MKIKTWKRLSIFTFLFKYLIKTRKKMMNDNNIWDVANSSGSFTYSLKKRNLKLDKNSTGKPNLNVVATYKPINPLMFLEILILCTTLILWTTVIVMLLFTAYLMNHKHTLWLLKNDNGFLISIILQLIVSTTLSCTAIFTCACHNPRYIQVPNLSKWAIMILSLSIIILTAEISTIYDSKGMSNDIENNLYKKFNKVVNNSIEFNEWNVLQQAITCCGVKSKEDWIKINQSIPKSCCKDIGNCSSLWEDGCSTSYHNMKKKFLSFLMGSASVALLNSVIILPLLIKLSQSSTKIVKELTAIENINKP